MSSVDYINAAVEMQARHQRMLKGEVLTRVEKIHILTTALIDAELRVRAAREKYADPLTIVGLAEATRDAALAALMEVSREEP